MLEPWKWYPTLTIYLLPITFGQTIRNFASLILNSNKPPIFGTQLITIFKLLRWSVNRDGIKLKSEIDMTQMEYKESKFNSR